MSIRRLFAWSLASLWAGHWVAASPMEPGSYPNCLRLDDAIDARLYYKVANQKLQILVLAKASGYIGVGFSVDGSMQYSDMIVSWIDANGQGQSFDYYAEQSGVQPTLDTVQNVELLGSDSTDGMLTFAVVRPLESTDAKDMAIPIDKSIALVWAVASSVPISEQNFEIHQSFSRYVHYVNFGNSNDCSQPPPNNPLQTFAPTSAPGKVLSEGESEGGIGPGGVVLIFMFLLGAAAGAFFVFRQQKLKRSLDSMAHAQETAQKPKKAPRAPSEPYDEKAIEESKIRATISSNKKPRAPSEPYDEEAVRESLLKARRSTQSQRRESQTSNLEPNLSLASEGCDDLEVGEDLPPTCAEAERQAPKTADDPVE